MYTLKVYLLVFLIRCSATSSVSDSDIFKKEYLNPRSVDHRKSSGRWYEQMDTLNDVTRDNTFVDFMVPCGERIRSVYIIHRWILSVEECHTKAIAFQPQTSDSPEGALILMSTNDTVGKLTFRYFDPHPTEGILVIHRQTLHLPDSYFVLCRQKDPSNLDKAIKQALRALHLDTGDFYNKSKDFGCERREENGIKL
ncbi:uncharacterized protein LOC125650186 [Ostrea edulis]|uniref:uncharacterized protein LOC125650186 n=1 Tax=Ostrea edulis TaxID=37623 RepID=UPI0024AEBECB|nr:uncharacterized protein LOC125650186 [Ostrea edulis]